MLEFSHFLWFYNSCISHQIFIFHSLFHRQFINLFYIKIMTSLHSTLISHLWCRFRICWRILNFIIGELIFHQLVLLVRGQSPPVVDDVGDAGAGSARLTSSWPLGDVLTSSAVTSLDNHVEHCETSDAETEEDEGEQQWQDWPGNISLSILSKLFQFHLSNIEWKVKVKFFMTSSW